MRPVPSPPIRSMTQGLKDDSVGARRGRCAVGMWPLWPWLPLSGSSETLGHTLEIESALPQWPLASRWEEAVAVLLLG